MERTSDWKVPAALILAGLALLVALSGRNFFSIPGGPQNAQSIVISAYPNTQPPDSFDPNGSGDPSNDLPQGGFLPYKPGVPSMPAPDVKKIPLPDSGAFDNLKQKLQDKVQYAYDFGGSSDPMQGGWDYLQGLIAYLSPLVQLAALGLLIWLGYGYLIRRNRPVTTYVASAQPTPPQAPPSAPNHGDITSPESHPGG
jgi:hypothetical protein